MEYRAMVWIDEPDADTHVQLYRRNEGQSVAFYINNRLDGKGGYVGGKKVELKRKRHEWVITSYDGKRTLYRTGITNPDSSALSDADSVSGSLVWRAVASVFEHWS